MSVKGPILVVDDSREGAEAFAELLDVMGWSAEPRFTAAEGLAACRNAHYACVFVDLNLPDLHGTALAERIRAEAAETGRMPPLIVAMSGYAPSDSAAGNVDAFDVYLRKPVEVDALEGVLAAIQQGRGGLDEAPPPVDAGRTAEPHEGDGPAATDAAAERPSPATAKRIADGVRYAVLLRLLPLLQHEIVGPLSSARMELGLAKRRLEKETGVDTSAVRAKLESVDEQLLEAIDLTRRIRRWDSLATKRGDAHATAEAVVGLLRSMLLMHGRRVEMADGLPDGALAEVVECELGYALAATLCHLHDTLDHAALLRVGFEAPSTLRIAIEPDEADAPRPADSAPIDRAALDAMLGAMGWRIDVASGGEQRTLLLHWPADGTAERSSKHDA